METTPPTTRLTEPIRYAAHESCDCGRERVTPAEWELVAQKAKEHGEFLIRDENGEMWRHLPFRLGGCVKRERPVEGYVFSQTAQGTPQVASVRAAPAGIPEEDPLGEPAPSFETNHPEGGERMKEENKEHVDQEVKLNELARMANVAVNSLRARLLRKGIQIIQRKTPTNWPYSVVAAKDLQAALECARAIRPRNRIKTDAKQKRHHGPGPLVSATAREAKSLLHLRLKGILSETEYQAAEAARRRKYEEAMGTAPAPIAAPMGVRSSPPVGDGISKALGLIRRVMEQNSISFLHYENGKLSARHAVSIEFQET